MMASAKTDLQTLLSLTTAILAIFLFSLSFSSAPQGVDRNEGSTVAPLTSKLLTACIPYSFMYKSELYVRFLPIISDIVLTVQPDFSAHNHDSDWIM